jgi:hypothetical protein
MVVHKLPAITYGRPLFIDSFLKTCYYSKLLEVSQIALDRESINNYL